MISRLNTYRACIFLAASSLAACASTALSPQGARVTVARSAPPPNCTEVAQLVGHGGGSLIGSNISNDVLIEYAQNDLRNKAAARGANYVQQDPPTLGQHEGTTTTATISATAYRCPTAEPTQTEAAKP
ncbi:DUF4156 domain-containing protein [Pendulispora brunnea]|uniref:DUF4156 domain-containing protein n=1 Tax=Pendulispora brunnea TaxID=2905690 RepID=A0ABZ2KT08_9BACT